MNLASGVIISGLLLYTSTNIPMEKVDYYNDINKYKLEYTSDDYAKIDSNLPFYNNKNNNNFELSQFTLLNDVSLEEKITLNNIEKYNIILNFSKKVLEDSIEADREILATIYDNFEDILL